MNDILQRLKQHKLVQWAVAYVAAAWVVLQVLGLIFGSYNWPKSAMHIAFGVLAVGFVVVLVLAWYHGERGAQRVSGMELLIVALILAVGGGVLWNFSRTTAKARTAAAMASVHASQPTGQRAAATAAGKTIAGSARTASAARHAAPAMAARPIPAKSVAVLPFENLSADTANAYFADGVQDLILTKLADIGDLKVIARTSTESYGAHPENLTRVGKRLGVATILEGSVQKQGKQVLINVQLIDAGTDSHIWAQSYQRTLDNIFGVEGEVADKVAHALNAKLTQAETTRVAAVPTHDPDAYNDYLRATHFANEAAKGGKITYLPKAIAWYKQAVKQDPTFALAWAGLSNARTTARYWGVNSSRDNLLEAGAAATRALTLAPDLPEAHLAMAGVQRFLYHNIEAAHAEDQRAVHLRPNSPDALEDLAINDWILGQTKASLKTLTHLIAVEPTQGFPVASLGLFQALDGNYPAARRALERALAINPQGAEAYAWLSRVDVLSRGDVGAAANLLDHMAPGTPKNLHVANQRIRLLLYRRDFAGARRLAAQFATRFDRGSGPVTIAVIRANIEWLARDLKAAHTFYRKEIALLAKPGFDVDASDHLGLAVAYARLGDAGKAMHEMDAAVRSIRHQHGTHFAYPDVSMAKVQLALGHKTKAIDALRKAMAQPGRGFLSPAVLKLDPTWDPIRHEPAFQALLKQSGKHEPVAAHTSASKGSGHGWTP